MRGGYTPYDVSWRSIADAAELKNAVKERRTVKIFDGGRGGPR
eukprot:IDg4171t1